MADRWTKQANEIKRLALLKWQCYINDHGYTTPRDLPMELHDLQSNCSFCETFRCGEGCGYCPLKPKEEGAWMSCMHDEQYPRYCSFCGQFKRNPIVRRREDVVIDCSTCPLKGEGSNPIVWCCRGLYRRWMLSCRDEKAALAKDVYDLINSITVVEIIGAIREMDNDKSNKHEDDPGLTYHSKHRAYQRLPGTGHA